MKKVRMFCLAITSIVLVSSCTKDVIQVKETSNIIYTDTPPKELFGPGVTYASQYGAWVDSVSLVGSVLHGYACRYWYDNNGNPNRYDCGQWHILPVRKYWGMIGEKIYLSPNVEWASITPDAYMQAVDVVKRKKVGIDEYICNSCDRNPLNTAMVIDDVR